MEIAISSGSDQIPTEMFQPVGETIRSEIQKLINYIWNKEELLSVEGVYYCTSLKEGR
jgi:hypothetical protein